MFCVVTFWVNEMVGMGVFSMLSEVCVAIVVLVGVGDVGVS